MHVPQCQQQLDAAALERETMHIRREGRPHLDQRGREAGQRALPRNLRQIVPRERMELHGNEVEGARSLRVAAPGVPGREEVVSQPEAGFQDYEAVSATPALGQLIAREKDMPGLGQRARDRVVHVAVRLGKRNALRIAG